VRLLAPPFTGSSLIGSLGARARAIDQPSSAAPTRVSLDSLTLTGALLALAAGLVMMAFWPGIIHFDTAWMIRDAHRGVALDWWSGIGTRMLGVWFALGLGIPPLWVAIVVINLLGLYGCLRLVLPRVAAAGVTLALVVFPPIYGQLASVSRDSAYVGFSLLAFAALARIMRTDGQHRRVLLAAAVACALIAAICRQNALAVLFGVVIFVLLHGHPVTRRRVIAAGLTASAAAALAYGGVVLGGSLWGVRAVHPERTTYEYDLEALSAAAGRDLFPERQLARLPPGAVTPPQLTEAAIRRGFQVWGINAVLLAHVDLHNTKLAREENGLLRTAWIKAVEADPLAYLRERTNLYLAMLGISGQPRDPPAGFYFDYGPLDQPDNYGHPLAFPVRYQEDTNLLALFVGNQAVLALDLPIVYLALLAVSLAYLWRRGAREALLAASMAAVAGMNQLILFFASMAAGSRYECLETDLGLLVAVVAVTVVLRRRASGHEPSTLARRVHLDQPIS
jgi:hypothetical protein